jgi:hypothetical protein
MREFFDVYPMAAWSLVSVLVALCFVVALWEHVKWWWLNTWYAFPIVGRSASLSRDSNRQSNASGWFKAERTLCQDYKNFIRIQSEYDFNEKITYLTKAGDNGRHETPLLIWVLTVVLVFIEAKGFSYVLAGYAIPGASEATQNLAAYGLSFIVSVIAVAFTHFAGLELYKSSKMRNARRAWNEAGRIHTLTSRTIPLALPQSLDDDEPEYTQLSNRVGHLPSYAITYATIAFILVVAIGATYVRVQVLDKQINESVRSQTSELLTKSDAPNGMDMNAKQALVPDADAQSSAQADVKGVNEDAEYDRKGGWTTFGILAFLFVFLQGLGILFGYRWGFAGQNSKDAYRALGHGKFTTYEDVREAFTRVVDKAQSKLEDLQQRMMARHGGIGTGDNFHTTKTFADFLREADEEDEKSRKEGRRKTKERIEEEKRDEQEKRNKKTSADIAAVAVKAIDVSQAEMVYAPVTASKLTEVEMTLAHLDAMGEDKAAKAAHLKTLSSQLYQDVAEALKVRKAVADAEKNKRDAEIEGLL